MAYLTAEVNVKVIVIVMLPLLIANLLSILIDYKLKSPFITFSSALLFVFTLPNIVYILLGDGYSSVTTFSVTIYGVLFLLSYAFARLGINFFLYGKLVPVNLYESAVGISRQIKISACCTLVFLLISMYSFGFSLNSMLSSSWSEWREQSDYLQLVGSFLFFIGASLTLLVVKYKAFKYVPLIIFTTIYVVAVLKTRNYLVTLFSPAIIYYIINKKFNLRSSIIGVLLVATVFALYSGARNIRHMGSINDISNSGFEFKFDSGEFELINTLYYFVEKGGVNNAIPHSTLIRISLLAIPESILPFEKPRDLSHILWDEKTGVLGVSGSLHVTAIGDSMLNSQYLGWFLYSLLYAVLFSFLDVILRREKLGFLWFGVFSVVGLYMARGAVYNGFVIVLITGFILCFFSLVARIKMVR